MIKSTFSILFIVRKSRLGKSGEAAITMRITVNGRFTEMNTLRRVPNQEPQRRDEQSRCDYGGIICTDEIWHCWDVVLPKITSHLL